MTNKFHTIVLYPRLQVDTIGVVFLLWTFGEKKFSGISQAKLEFWNRLPEGKTPDSLEKEGVLVIDIGKGRFDHHTEENKGKKETASTLIGKYLGVYKYQTLKRFFSFVRRDDLEGKGIISQDTIDRMFGLPAIIRNLSRDYPDHPEFVVEIVYRIYLAQFHEEYRRKVLMPRQWDKLLAEKLAWVIEVPRGGGRVKVVFVKSDSETLPGYLRAVNDVKADIVVQQRSSGHINLITSQTGKTGRINLGLVVQVVRQIEAKRKNMDLTKLRKEELQKPGNFLGIEEWFYDTAANTLQNGGIDPLAVPATKLTLRDVQTILEKVLPIVG